MMLRDDDQEAGYFLVASFPFLFFDRQVHSSLEEQTAPLSYLKVVSQKDRSYVWIPVICRRTGRHYVEVGKVV